MNISLFHSATSQFDHLPNVHSVATMNTISHLIEKQVIQLQLSTVLYAGFQRFSNFPYQKAYYAQLGAVCDHVYILGIPDMPLTPIPNVTFVALDPASPLAAEWFLVVDSSAFWTTLIAKQIDVYSTTMRNRQFEGIWSYDEAVVGHVAQEIAQVVGREHDPITQRDYASQNTTMTKLNQHFMRELEDTKFANQHQRTQLLTLYTFMDALTRDLPTPYFAVNHFPMPLLEDLVHILYTFFEATDVAVVLRERNEYYPVIASRSSHRTHPHTLRSGDGISVQAIEQEIIICIDDVAQRQEREPLMPNAKSLIAVPIFGKHGVYGAITVGDITANNFSRGPYRCGDCESVGSQHRTAGTSKHRRYTGPRSQK
ncbi:MAG: GAF domain-containing protein [Chloroflexi bacterium AL-W]|nr:GAF domain-containing protein [Chloroflexi bacterium AL-N1]NOK68513.1 GAF domain-containing protein [Chloroflexi bacterium AL-N10]NOK74159.1 GAF domain-containing protein [Chloroflexi bacterium AL-N5]NOK83126.1 GAF domain-containing protein [Chloroflexi bacterium AL-W]NOK90649.1 GAF domain-containing protein [Chloroflexi bacterium AL-N15]